MQRHTIAGLVVFVAAAAGFTGVLCGVWLADGPATPAAASRSSLHAIDVLHAWDRRRARAYAAGDARGLRDLYVSGSTAGVRDVRLLMQYAGRGFRVEEMRMQVLAVDVIVRRPDLLRLEVTDRLHDAVAARDGLRVTLPRDQASTREITLVRSGDGTWRVESVLSQR